MRALTIFKQKDLPAETKLKEIPPDEQAILDCIARTKKFVTQRALVTAGASAIPIPGINVTVDVTMLISILNFINQEFGLTPQQIQHLSTDKQVQLFQLITVTGSAWAGKLITKSLVLAVLKKLSIQLTAAQAAKWLPIAGQAAAAGLSFAALKWIGNQHIQDCARIARLFNEEGRPRSRQTAVEFGRRLNLVIRHTDRNQKAVVQNCLKHHSDVLLQRLSDRCLVTYRRESSGP